MMNEKSQALRELLAPVPVVPVLIIEDWHQAVPLARALVDGGLTNLEITLRTPVALECIAAIAGEIEEAVVGAGTVLNPRQYGQAEAVGARFIVSPGATENLLAAAADSPVPYLPGVANAAEAMRCLERGLSFLKFFPAGPAGGVAYLKALASPLSDIVFCPTGGISLENAASYLTQPNVLCVGGSWVAPSQALKAGDYATITRLAREAVALRPAN